MTILIDTNIVLDVWLKRQLFFDASSRLLTYVESNDATGYVCATTVTTLFYIARKAVGQQITLQAISNLLEVFHVAPVNEWVLKAAVDSHFSDFEDAVLYESAKCVGAEAIVTRNGDDFEKSDIPIYSPDDLNALLDLRGDDN